MLGKFFTETCNKVRQQVASQAKEVFRTLVVGSSADLAEYENLSAEKLEEFLKAQATQIHQPCELRDLLKVWLTLLRDLDTSTTIEFFSEEYSADSSTLENAGGDDVPVEDSSNSFAAIIRREKQWMMSNKLPLKFSVESFTFKEVFLKSHALEALIQQLFQSQSFRGFVKTKLEQYKRHDYVHFPDSDTLDVSSGEIIAEQLFVYLFSLLSVALKSKPKHIWQLLEVLTSASEASFGYMQHARTKLSATSSQENCRATSDSAVECTKKEDVSSSTMQQRSPSTEDDACPVSSGDSGLEDCSGILEILKQASIDIRQTGLNAFKGALNLLKTLKINHQFARYQILETMCRVEIAELNKRIANADQNEHAESSDPLAAQNIRILASGKLLQLERLLLVIKREQQRVGGLSLSNMLETLNKESTRHNAQHSDWIQVFERQSKRCQEAEGSLVKAEEIASQRASCVETKITALQEQLDSLVARYKSLEAELALCQTEIQAVHNQMEALQATQENMQSVKHTTKHHQQSYHLNLIEQTQLIQRAQADEASLLSVICDLKETLGHEIESNQKITAKELNEIEAYQNVLICRHFAYAKMRLQLQAELCLEAATAFSDNQFCSENASESSAKFVKAMHRLDLVYAEAKHFLQENAQVLTAAISQACDSPDENGDMRSSIVTRDLDNVYLNAKDSLDPYIKQLDKYQTMIRHRPEQTSEANYRNSESSESLQNQSKTLTRRVSNTMLTTRESPPNIAPQMFDLETGTTNSHDSNPVAEDIINSPPPEHEKLSPSADDPVDQWLSDE